MDKNYEFIFLLKNIVNSSSLGELKGCVVKGNEFLREYEIPETSIEFQKLRNVTMLMKLKLKSEEKSRINECTITTTYR
jgi:hypothetical protein